MENSPQRKHPPRRTVLAVFVKEAKVIVGKSTFPPFGGGLRGRIHELALAVFITNPLQYSCLMLPKDLRQP